MKRAIIEKTQETCKSRLVILKIFPVWKRGEILK